MSQPRFRGAADLPAYVAASPAVAAEFHCAQSRNPDLLLKTNALLHRCRLEMSSTSQVEEGHHPSALVQLPRSPVGSASAQ